MTRESSNGVTWTIASVTALDVVAYGMKGSRTHAWPLIAL
jgi:hypothetical protein